MKELMICAARSNTFFFAFNWYPLPSNLGVRVNSILEHKLKLRNLQPTMMISGPIGRKKLQMHKFKALFLNSKVEPLSFCTMLTTRSEGTSSTATAATAREVMAAFPSRG